MVRYKVVHCFRVCEVLKNIVFLAFPFRTLLILAPERNIGGHLISLIFRKMFNYQKRNARFSKRRLRLSARALGMHPVAASVRHFLFDDARR